MILASVLKLKQNGGGYINNNMQIPNIQSSRELAIIDASIQILTFCSHRNPFARRYLIQIKDLRRQLSPLPSSEPSPNSGGPSISHSSTMSSSASTLDSPEDVVADTTFAPHLNFQNLGVASGSEHGITSRPPTVGPSRTGTFGAASGAYPSSMSPSLDVESWPSTTAGQFGAVTLADLLVDSTTFMLNSDEINPENFWDEMGE